MLAIGLILVNLVIVISTLSYGSFDVIAALVMFGAGVGCFIWDINKEDARLAKKDASYRSRELRRQEAVLTICTATSWFSGFFVIQTIFGIDNDSVIPRCVLWLAVSIGLSIWCKKVSTEYQESVRN